MPIKRILKPYTLFLPFAAFLTTILFSNCNSQASNEGLETNKLLSLPVYEIDTATAITEKDYLGTIEGKVNVEIRPQQLILARVELYRALGGGWKG